MAPETLRLPDYLDHMLEAIRRVDEYTQGMEEHAFLQDSLRQDAVLRNLQNLGEASRNVLRLDDGFTARHPNLALTSAYQLRNAIAHGYEKVDLRIIWRTVRFDLPPMRATLLIVRASLA
jgi:uncharacterized protein with HEPN domain